MSKDQYEAAKPLAWVAMALILFFLLADAIGRLREIFIHEWRYISWGLVILASSLWFIMVAYEELKRRRSFEQIILKRLADSDQKLNQLDVLSRSERASTSSLIKQISARVEDHSALCERTIQRIDEIHALAQVRHAANQVTQAEPMSTTITESVESLERAMQEVAGGQS